MPLVIAIQWIASKEPAFVEHIYSRSIYPVLIKVISFFTGWFPFSLSECLLILFIIWILWKTIRATIHLFQQKRSIWNLLAHTAINGLAIIALLYASFIFLWGFNYQRLPIADSLELDVSPASVAEVKSLCTKLVSDANALRKKVNEDENGVMRLQSSRWNALDRAHLGSKKVALNHTCLSTGKCHPKGIGLSSLMKFVEIPGIYICLTGEPNVCLDIPLSSLPFSACHEVAHQMGIAREDEANYIAYLSCKAHPDADYQYSGTLRMMMYALAALSKVDGKSYRELRASCDQGVKRDMRFITAFWTKKVTPVNRVVRKTKNKVNNTYLKSQRQSQGIRSYGMVVDLLIAEQRSRIKSPPLSQD